MGMAYKNLAVFRHEVGFFSDASEQVWGFDSEQSVFFIMNATSTKSTKLCVTKKRVVNNFLSWDVAMKSEFALWNQLYNFTNS